MHLRACLFPGVHTGILDKYRSWRFGAMARTLRDIKLDSREARAKLKVRGKPYWRLLEGGLHLGYRRLSKRPGSWCVRKYVGQQRYAVEALAGVADDYSEADGVTVLSFAMAQRKALDHKPKVDGPLT